MADAGVLDHHIDEQLRPRGIDRIIGELAERQHGVVARRQVRALGIGRGAIDLRVADGRLHPIHRGVYAVGHRVLSVSARWIAAVLAAGPQAVLSHRSAAALWGIRRSSRARTEVTLPHRRRRSPGIESHLARLPADEVTALDGIPVTSLPRTLLDLAVVLRPGQVESAINEAEARRLSDPLSLEDLLRRYPRRHGTPVIRAIVEDGRVGATRTRGELEMAFLELIDRTGLPRPETNLHVMARGRLYEADCVWREQRLIVELDSRTHHATTAAFERDRARDRALSVAEWRTVRVTWRHLHEGAAELAADLRALLVPQALAARPRRPGGAPERLEIAA